MARLLFVMLFSLLFGCNSSPAPDEAYTGNALDRLKEGNERFQAGKAVHPHVTRQRIAEMVSSQKPFAIIISCSDSRVPPEIVFDQGLGDLFVIRTAGNVLSNLETGSLEYAVEHLKVETIVVMGHEECGVMKVAAENSKEEGNLASLIKHIKEEEEVKAITEAHPSTNKVVQANIRHAVSQIKNLPGILKEKLQEGKLQVVGAEYYLHGGKVVFFKN